MEWSERIRIDPDLLVGKPVVAAAVRPSSSFRACSPSTQSEADISSSYPELTHEKIPAWLAYASYVPHEYNA